MLEIAHVDQELRMIKQFKKMTGLPGQGTVEYAILLSLLVIGMILVLSIFGVSVSDLYCNAARALGSQKACAGKTEYCNDSFDGDLSNWPSANNKLSTKDGQMCFSNPLASLNSCSAAMKQKDYAVKVDDIVLSKGDGYGVFFRATDEGKGISGYILQYDPGLKSNANPNGSLVIRKWVNGREIWEPVASTPMGPDVYNTPHDIEISTQGDEIKVFMDGKEVLTAKDGTYTDGASGIRSWDGSSTCMGNFSIVEPSK